MRIKLSHLTRCLMLLVLVLLFSTGAGANDLSGKVTEVIDGNTINLKSLNHTIKVRLLAVAPPEKSQPYGDVARQHLSDLILGKFVAVRYTGIGGEGYLVGRILLEQADINAQMLRDGVAWYYQPDDSDLSATERQIYTDCEQAARAEKRGLWGGNDPMPPWEFRRKEEDAARIVAVTPPSVSGRPTLSIEKVVSTPSMLRSNASPGVPLSKIADKPAESRNANAEWTKYKLMAKGATILVPANGERKYVGMPLADGRMGEFVWYTVRSGRTAYVVMSSTATLTGNRRDPVGDSNIATVLDATMQAFIASIKSDYQSQGINFRCEPIAVREFFVWEGAYDGREYSLAGCSIPGTVRIYINRSREPRSVHLAAAFYLDGKENANVKTFFQSMTLGEARLPYSSVSSVPAP